MLVIGGLIILSKVYKDWLYMQRCLCEQELSIIMQNCRDMINSKKLDILSSHLTAGNPRIGWPYLFTNLSIHHANQLRAMQNFPSALTGRAHWQSWLMMHVWLYSAPDLPSTRHLLYLTTRPAFQVSPPSSESSRLSSFQVLPIYALCSGEGKISSGQLKKTGYLVGID